ncbi:MAG: PEP/pyruvate-binding domain-containing protein [Myxococcota bacterium]
MRLAAGVLLLACAGSTPVVEPPTHTDPPATEVETETFAAEIPDAETWSRLAYRPEYQTAARTEVVKLLIDMEDDWRTYFLDSAEWELHFNFAREVIGYQRHEDEAADHRAFNLEQYRRPGRRFLLASLVHYLDADVWAYEMVPGDTLDAERLGRAFAHVRERIYFGENLRFRPLSPRQEAHARALGDAAPAVDLASLMANVAYQPLVTGTAYGYLRIVRGELDVSALRPNDLVVSEHVPSELPPVSALVTSTLQAPLAHVAILSRNRGTPDMAFRDAINQERFTRLEGQLVKLTVGPQEFQLEAANVAEAEEAWRFRRPTEGFTPRRDDSVEALREVCDLRLEDVLFAGAKAAQLGEVCRLGVETPGGFVVPFHHYRQHIASLESGIASMLVDGAFRTDASARAERLGELRAIIERRRIDRRLLRQIRRRLRGSTTRWIFRSSTNAEDLPGFNGAGLYRSVVVDANASERAIEDALREVWSSVWLQRAFEERDWFRIGQAAVSMAVLIQPFVDEVVGNGVAITRNPFDEGRPGLFVNVQTREGSVTGAGDNEIPEQVLIYTWSETLEFEVVSRSSRTEGAAILEEADLEALGTLLQRLHDELHGRYGAAANAMDVEFLLREGERRFVVVQARPILVRYAEGQQWRDP